jgi:hypothetical protein
MGVFLMISGIVACAGGIFGKNFYVADVLSLAAYKQKSSTWSGRLVFLLVGMFLVAVGIKLLVGAK